MMPRFPVRRARPADLDGILAIEKAAFGRWAWDRNLFAEYARTCGELFLIAEAGGRIAGYSIGCITRRAGVLRAELDSIAVAPDARGSGVADALIASTFR